MISRECLQVKSQFHACFCCCCCCFCGRSIASYVGVCPCGKPSIFFNRKNNLSWEISPCIVFVFCINSLVNLCCFCLLRSWSEGCRPTKFSLLFWWHNSVSSFNDGRKSKRSSSSYSFSFQYFIATAFWEARLFWSISVAALSVEVVKM